MRLLHVSDLHFSDRDVVDRRAVLATFLDDVVEQNAQQRIEAVVVSGDIAFAGLAAEYQLAHVHFLDPLLDHLSLGRERIVLAPGNHDIDRSRIDEYTEKGLQDQLNSREALTRLFDGGRLPRYVDRLKDYNEFHTQFYSAAPPAQAGYLAACHRIETTAGPIGFAALNTAWRATGGPNDADRGRLLLGDRQLRRCIEQLDNCRLRVAVMHHPLDWLAAFDADDVKVDLERGFDIVLSGHLHEAEPMQLLSARGRCIYGQAGCVYETIDYPNSYSLIDIDLELNQVTFLVRRYFRARREFDCAVDMAPGGRIEFELPSSLPIAAGPRSVVAQVPHNAVLGVLVEIAHETSVLADHVAQLSPRSVQELLVPPVYLPVPHEQAVAALEPGSPRRVKRVDILQSLQDHQCIVVAGDPETGLTSSLLWALESHYVSDDRLPVYIRFSDIGPGKDPVGRVVAAALSRFPEASNADVPPPLVVGVDEVDPRASKAFARLVSHMLANPSSRFLIGCHREYHDIVMRSVEEAGVSVERVFLGPFGRRDLKILARKFVGSLDRVLVDRVLDILHSEQLPRTPFLMAALVVVLDATDLAPHERSETAIIERYVDLLLGRVSPSEDARVALDFRNYEHILASFASHLVGRDARRMSRLEAETFLVDYWRRKGWSGSPARVLDALVGRRMLIEDRDGVGFRHSALHHLFIAKQMFEDPVFREGVMKSPLDFSSSVRHAAALNRSDRGLLERVGQVLEACLSELEDIDESLFPRIGADPGWSQAPGLERAAMSLRPVPHVPPDVVDEQMDVMWDDLEAADATSVQDPESTPSSRFLAAIELLSIVLRNSELLDDVEMKDRLLREAIRGWGIAAVLLAFVEDQTHAYRDMVKTMFGAREGGRLRESQERILDAIVKSTAVFVAGISCLMSLGSVKMVGLLERVLDDEEFMAEPANAFFGTFLYFHLTTHDRARRLKSLLDQHGSNTVIRDIGRHLALLAYYRESLGREEETGFENLLVDIGMSNQNVRGGAERTAARSYLLAEVRKARILASAKQLAVADGLLDVEAEPVAVEGEEVDD